MSSLWMVALVAGAAVGLGVGAMAYLVAVPQRPALAPLMKLAASRPQPALSMDVVLPQGRGGARGRLVAMATRWVDVDWLTSPDADLAIIEKSRQQFLLERVGLTLIGLCIVPIWGVMMWALGVELPVLIPLLGSIALAVGFWFLSINRVRVAAAERRREMRYALVSYLTLVALHRAAGEGAAASLELAARASDSWAFRRIDRQVSAALRSQKTEWQALQDLAHELQIDELADLSSIAETAGVMGAHIGPTLLARAGSLRHELMSKEQTAAAESTNRMVFPKMMLGFVLVGFLLFPPFVNLVFN
jgi:ABC-type multidrug transport system fused ATPase/permease subunit